MIRADQVKPSPVLTQYVLKVHSRCNLSCDHCYVYEHADQSWRGRPMVMAPETVTTAARRIAEHAVEHRVHTVEVVLHGGEPLLLGLTGLREVISRIRSEIDPVVRLRLSLQSNGVGLTPEMCELFVQERVRVGISLDGDRTANDRHRRFANGSSSHAQVRAALGLLRRPEFRAAYAGILCTIDIANDPIVTYEALLAEEPPRLDFLLPHATWENPPARPAGVRTPYADWLVRIHRRWVADGRPVPIRTFDALHSTRQNGPSRTESLGLDPADLVVVEADGAWEQADSLKTAYDGAPATARTVFSHSVDETLTHPGIAARFGGLAGLSVQCRSCPVVAQCGGGLLAHRYRTGTGFRNPSVYCADLKELIVSTSEQVPPAESAGTGTTALPAEVLDEIATGHVGTDTVDLLDQLQAELLEALLQEVAGDLGDGDGEHPWDALVRLSTEAPEAVRDVLAHPYVRVWANACLRHRADPRFLGNVAAAAAVRTGLPARLPVLCDNGVVHLPSVAAVVTGERSGTIQLTMDDAGSPAAPVPDPGSESWASVRRLRVGPWSPLLDDVDAYRNCFDWTAAPRLTGAECERWTSALAGAHRIVADQAAGHLPGLTAGVRVITPLRPGADGTLRAASARQAYAAVGLALAAPEEMAVLLVHEFQHVKLGAVLDHVDLYDPGYLPRIPVGWRPDPRPVEGVLHGAYAHLAVTEMWRSRTGTVARAKYAHYRDWTRQAAEALLNSGALSRDGERFVHRIVHTLLDLAR
ncbi:MAG TPA: FxsB family cyclophane-forming radical SAM/SPASM peptide maturase [Actinoplanes sp.]